MGTRVGCGFGAGDGEGEERAEGAEEEGWEVCASNQTRVGYGFNDFLRKSEGASWMSESHNLARTFTQTQHLDQTRAKSIK